MSDITQPPDPLALLKALPEALRPHVALGEPNEPIPIYSGPLSLSQAGKTILTDAIITLPAVVFFEAPNV